MRQEDKNFTITFWIRVAENSGWKSSGSKIHFPPITVRGDIRIYFSKIENKFKIYVLHPEIGYRKVTADIQDFIGEDAFIAFTNSSEKSKLYINGEIVKEVNVTDMKQNLEIDDYVMIELKGNESNKISIQGGKVYVPARIKEIDEEEITVNLLDLEETLTLPKNRIRY